MAKSWSWTLPLTQAVADQATVEVPTPDYDEERADPDTAELAIGSVVVDIPEEGTVEFDGENATVTNLTGDDWAAGDVLYVYVKAKTPDAESAGELEGRVQTLESEVTDLQARVAALEGGATRKVSER
jgi:hypothetical protein